MIEDLFREGVIRLAEQPKDNPRSLEELKGYKLILIPIDHDYPGGSAAMHNAVFKGFNFAYRTAFVVGEPKNIEVIINTFRMDPRYVGGGVGSGFKDKAVKYVDMLSESAKTLGSINVIEKIGGKLIGHNTDGVGFVKGFLKEYPDSVCGKNILILGAGGTTLPIAYELSQLKPKKIIVLNRTVEKAKAITDAIKPFVESRYGGEEIIGEEMRSADIVINTSNKGAGDLKEYTAFAPVCDKHFEIAGENLRGMPKSAIVADILLEEETKTLIEAMNLGFRTHNGKNMNLFQAIPAFKLMTGMKEISDQTLEEIMRSAR